MTPERNEQELYRNIPERAGILKTAMKQNDSSVTPTPTGRFAFISLEKN